MAKAPRRGECWESDRGIQAKVCEVHDDSVVIELVEARLATFLMERKVFELTFKHLAYSEPSGRPLAPARAKHHGLVGERPPFGGPPAGSGDVRCLWKAGIRLRQYAILEHQQRAGR